jgi:Ni/Co efflux regulator RcnB
MKKIISLALAAGLLLSFAFAAAPALARGNHDDHDNRGDRRERGHDRSDNIRWNDRDPVVYRQGKRVYYIPNDERMVIREYYVERYPCPPGHMKKGKRGCLTEAHPRYGRDRHYKVRYVIGKPLPPEVVYAEVPQPLLVRLGGPPSPGLRYVQVDDDVLLISEATKKVIDAVTLFSAVN